MGEDLIHTLWNPNLQIAEGELNNNNKGTSKRHKLDEKGTHVLVHIPPSIIGVKKYIHIHYTQHPFKYVEAY